MGISCKTLNRLYAVARFLNLMMLARYSKQFSNSCRDLKNVFFLLLENLYIGQVEWACVVLLVLFHFHRLNNYFLNVLVSSQRTIYDPLQAPSYQFCTWI